MKRNSWWTNAAALGGTAGLLAAGCAPSQPTSLTPNTPGGPAATDAPQAKKAALPPAKVAADPHVRQVVAADTAFGLALLGELAHAAPGKNVFVSPFGLADALHMALNGADGATAKALAAGLRLPPALPPAQVNAANALLLPSLSDPDPKVQLSVANALWARTGTPFRPAFAKTCRDAYGAQASELDFAQPSAAKTVNDWASKNTHGKITAIVDADSLAPARLLLTNAVYFHGTWADPFHPEDTASAPFHRETGGPLTLPLMARTGWYAYTQTPRFQAVRLPYGAGRMDMVVLLPRPGVPLDAVVKSLDAKTWAASLAALEPTHVALQLPRFRVEYGQSMTGPLSALGMGAAFAPGADFGPMGLPAGNGLTGVLHKAVIEVNEEGTVAAAVTAVGAGAGAPSPVTPVRVDRPFVCAIRDSATGALLFVGAIRDPEPLP